MYKARIAILNTYGQHFERTHIEVDQNFKRDHTDLIMKLAAQAGRLQKLARRADNEKYFLHIEIPECDELEDDINRWINAIANSQLKSW